MLGGFYRAAATPVAPTPKRAPYPFKTLLNRYMAFLANGEVGVIYVT